MATASHLDLAPRVTLAEPVDLGLDLFPVAAAEVESTLDGLRIVKLNRAFRMAGLADSILQADLLQQAAPRVAALFASDHRSDDFDWTAGEGIACRYYRVSAARAGSRCVLTLLDQTARVSTERSLRREMTTDSLTGLLNREGFTASVFAGSGLCAVMVIDLARFGRINACMGGLAGDELLITVARRIKGALRARDVLARIGGNEFAILVDLDDAAEEAVALGGRVQRVLANPFRLTDFEIAVECAVGIAFGNAGDEVEELLRQAQFATKRAKTSGRIETYQNHTFAIARAAFGLETELRQAIEEQRLRLAFQPICDMTTGQVVSFEALARWCDEDGRERSPTDFIPVAEESGLIIPLGRWAIDEAARTIAHWDAQRGGNSQARLAVNLSAIQLHRDPVPDLVQAALETHGIAGDRFSLELTESALVSDPERIAGVMHALKGMGARLAMDDFGTGYSNLAYLQQLPIDILKIDRSFVTDMLADRDKVAIVRAILGLAQALGMSTTAEGVETRELSHTLAALGCTYGQGYFYARPLEADAALAMLTA